MRHPAPARRLVEATGLYYGWCIVLVAFLAYCVDTYEIVFGILGAATVASGGAAQGLTFLRFRE